MPHYTTECVVCSCDNDPFQSSTDKTASQIDHNNTELQCVLSQSCAKTSINIKYFVNTKTFILNIKQLELLA